MLVLIGFDYVAHCSHVYPAQLHAGAGGPGGHVQEGERGGGHAQKREITKCFPNSKFSKCWL